MNRRNTFILLAVTFFLFLCGNEQTGVTLRQVNSEYYFSAGTNILALILSPLLIAFLFLHRPKGTRESTESIVPLWRRFAAFIIDFMSAVLPSAAVFALPAILLEWHYTGTLSWQFSRDFSRPSDTLLALGAVIPCFAWLIFYFSYPMTKGSQTIGQYILGYRISVAGLPSVSFRRAILRTVLSFMVLALGWLSVPLAFFHKRKHMLHDSVDGLRPELVNYKTS